MQNVLAGGLLGAAVLLAALGLATLLPSAGSTINDLGYHSLCPLAPWSSLAMLVLAGIAAAIRGYVLKRA